LHSIYRRQRAALGSYYFDNEFIVLIHSSPISQKRFKVIESETKDAGEAGRQDQNSALRLYEVVNQDGVSISVFVWRTKFALAKKGLAYESVAVGYRDIPNIGSGTLKTVPILQSNDTFIMDSWVIAEWLDRMYPDRPLIFQSPSDLAMMRFFEKWFSTAGILMLRACLGALHDTLRHDDRGYFKTTREQRLGETFEAMAPKIADNISAMRTALQPIRRTVQEQPFIGGEEPNYADFIGYAALISLGSVSPSTLFDDDDPILPWVQRGQLLLGSLGTRLVLPGLPQLASGLADES
jgi:glutathione S-transferase